MSETTNKGYNLPTVGADYSTWGGLLNANWDILDLNLGGEFQANVAGNSNYTLSATNAQNVLQNLTGVLTGNIDFILPALGSFYFIANNTTGAYSITVTTGSGDTVVVPQGSVQWVFCDGTNVLSSVTVAGEFITNELPFSLAIQLSNGVVANLIAITLSAGDWDIWGAVALNNAANPTILSIAAGVTTVSGAFPTDLASGGVSAFIQPGIPTTYDLVIPTGTVRMLLTGTTTVYLVVNCGFSSGNCFAYGSVSARRAA